VSLKQLMTQAKKPQAISLCGFFLSNNRLLPLMAALLDELKRDKIMMCYKIPAHSVQRL
jgi:hypothetical protein